MFVQNNSEATLTFAVQQHQTPLNASHWRSRSTTIEPGERAELLWFNRDKGITNNKTFEFSSTATLGDSKLILRQRLRGLLINSDLWQSVSIDEWTDEWYKDRGWHEKAVAQGTFQVQYRAYFTGTDDDIEYVVTQLYKPLANNTPRELSLLSYNLYLRPVPVFLNGQRIRASLLPDYIQHYDVVLLQEVFDNPSRRELLDRLKGVYPYSTRMVGEDNGLTQDSGLLIMSRWPIELERHFSYTECAENDCLAKKGVIYVKINKGGYPFHMFNTHVQNGASAAARVTRAKQFAELRQFIDLQMINGSEPVLIGGDFNVDSGEVGEWLNVLKALAAVTPSAEGLPHSFAPSKNSLADAAASTGRLDHVLYSQRHAQPVDAINHVQLLRTTLPWKEFGFERDYWDLSDHFPIHARFAF